MQTVSNWPIRNQYMNMLSENFIINKKNDTDQNIDS